MSCLTHERGISGVNTSLKGSRGGFINERCYGERPARECKWQVVAICDKGDDESTQRLVNSKQSLCGRREGRKHGELYSIFIASKTRGLLKNKLTLLSELLDLNSGDSRGRRQCIVSTSPLPAVHALAYSPPSLCHCGPADSQNERSAACRSPSPCTG